LDSVHTSDTLTDPANPVTIGALPLPQPVFVQAIHCKDKKEEEKLIALLQKASEEDPTLRLFITQRQEKT
jgi:elongation factor G